ncbi:class I SAM-dependent methyltransferase [Actinomycetospora lutea]|uniref:class I SAM-dependent methyltransferase n=1 Tax=Actinomycetospora lutea TaxID=663604 RepID=UPI0023666AD0|nr:class I SAM-dependent methyltransferase [Actinomycetospora lutea]MDD7940266.1 class I SAM-dependent methyltransferase [Actinomycetospora lutea]
MTVDRYAWAATGWATGAARVYGPLATQLVGAAPHPLAGRRVLDAGAGTGLASTALRGAGARPVAVDRSPAMLARDAATRPPAAVGALEALPLRDDAVDDSVAAFVLNHVDDPAAALRELARVTRPGGAVLATAPGATTAHRTVRDRIDAVAADAGFTPPDWYAHLTTVQAPLLGDVPAMRGAARAAGLVDVAVTEHVADVGVERPEDLVDYRLGQAHVAGWLAGLAEGERDALRRAAIAAVAPVMEPYRPPVITLVARVP